MKDIIRAFVLVAACIAAATAAAEERKVNRHNTGDCLFCHGETPRFGVDTRATVTFREAGADDPALCMRCHQPRENLHPIRVKPGGEGALATVAPRAVPLGSSAGFEGLVVCTSCHFVHAADSGYALLRGFPGSQEPARYGSWQNLCRECHGSDLEKRSPHAGDEKACAFCHMATPMKGQPVSVAARGAALCNFCHGGIQNRHFEKANPFTREVSCPDCHEPHLGPDRPGRLSDAYLAAAGSMTTIDPHYRRGLCFACHAKGEKAPLLTDDPVALCNRCHGTGKIVGDTHPLKAPSKDIAMPKDWPLRNGSLTCLTCHRAGHREDRDYFKFLRGGPYKERNDVCFICHNREAFVKLNPHQEVGRMQGCEFCHVGKPVPGKDNSATVRLVADAVILCLRCHPDEPHPSGVDHAVGLTRERAAEIPRDFPLGAGNRMTCATCHNPHVEESENLKLRGGVGGMEVCGFCHRF